MRLDLPDLRLFLNVVERGSITLGASSTFITVSAASERIKLIEQEVGTSLLERLPRGVRPNAAGLRLAEHAKVVLNQHERMCSELSEFGSGLRGMIRLLSNTAALSEFLPDIMASYLFANPGIDIQVEERQSHEIVQAVMNGERDLGIVADFVATGDLESYPLALDQLVLVTPLKHQLSGLSSIEFRKTVAEDFVGLFSNNALTEHLEMRAAALMGKLRWRAQVSSFNAICRLVAREVGVGIISETAALEASRSLDIKIVRLADEWARRRLHLCVRKANSLPNHIQRFIEHVVQT